MQVLTDQFLALLLHFALTPEPRFAPQQLAVSGRVRF